MSLFQRVSRRNPCPICHAPDWCQFGDRAMKCMRVQSEHPCEQGGWWHFYDKGFAEKARDFIPSRTPPPRSINAGSLMLGWMERTMPESVTGLAADLGVTELSLNSVGVAWAAEYNAWAFPMKDGEGKTIGIRLRNAAGFKWAVRGSSQGIFIPDSEFNDPTRTVFLPEGPTDTAACLSLGLWAIGRPNCLTGAEQITTALKRIGAKRVVVVADNDSLKKRPDGSEFRPGYDGARALQKSLKMKSILWHPPGAVKDVRDFISKGGTAQLIQSMIKDRVWPTK